MPLSSGDVLCMVGRRDIDRAGRTAAVTFTRSIIIAS